MKTFEFTGIKYGTVFTIRVFTKTLLDAVTDFRKFYTDFEKFVTSIEEIK
jgi:hypothetical protein